MAKESKRKKVSFAYLKHALKPEDLLDFVESREFTRGWDNLGLNDEDDLTALQLVIMAGPKNAPIVKVTGGLRKLRFAPEQWNIGKRGAARVCYVYFEKFGLVYLVLVYGKGEQDDISSSQCLVIKKHIREIEKQLERRGTIN